MSQMGHSAIRAIVASISPSHPRTNVYHPSDPCRLRRGRIWRLQGEQTSSHGGCFKTTLAPTPFQTQR
eukprot:scaffold10389_cov35-Prasinocladus_malaysianus.AAC.1